MALIRCSQEFHKWIMEKAFNDNNPVSVVLDRIMVREKEEPDEKPEFKVEMLEGVCEKLDQLAIEVKEVKSILEETSFEKCPSCFGRVKDNKCQECGAVKVGRKFVPPDDVKFVPPDDVKEEEEGEGRREEKDSFICDCGEKIEKVEDNINTAFWSGEEYLRCQKCGSLRNLKYLGK